MSALLAGNARAINASQFEGLVGRDMWLDEFVGYEWKADWCLRCGSMPGAVHADDHL